MELVYELNLPAAKEIFAESFVGFDDDNCTTNYQFCLNLSAILKPEWLNFRNLAWDHLLYFKKSNFEGQIHTDLGTNKENLKYEYTPWGITWAYDGSGILEYWDSADLIKGVKSDGSNNNSNLGVVTTYQPTKAPIKSYELKENCCYIVNGKEPHRASGLLNRRIISLRAKKSFYKSWNNIANEFQDIII